MKKVVFDHEDPGTRAANAVCSSSEESQVIRSVMSIERMLRSAYEKWDSRLFKKWFGVSTQADDANVKLRFKRAMDMMYDKNRNWKLMCCPRNAYGACKGCANPRVLAYVTAKSWSNKPEEKISNTNIRVCSLSFKTPYPEKELGLTMFHELMHVTSGAGDQGYTKLECFNNAKNDPTRARLNAAAYTYFAMESAMTRPNYEKYSKGMSIFDENCRDRYSNCYALASQGCCTARRA